VNLLYFHRYSSERIPSFTPRGNKDEHLNFSGKREEMKKRVGRGAGEIVYYSWRNTYIFFMLLRSECRHGAVEIKMITALEKYLCHALGHLSPFSRLVTQITSRRSIDLVTLSI